MTEMALTLKTTLFSPASSIQCSLLLLIGLIFITIKFKTTEMIK
jgi:hypothetical protein